MAEFTPKNREFLITEMEDYIISHTDKVSDFNEGSLISAIIGAVGTIVEEAYYEIVLGWSDTMRTAMMRSIDFNRLEGSKSTGNVVFGTSSAPTVDILIQAGTVIVDDDGNQFVTTQDGTLNSGNTESGSIAIESIDIGEDKNVAANTITTLISTINGIETVTNPTKTLNGSDRETDTEYHTRFAEHLKGLIGPTPSGIKKAALDVVGVKETVLVEEDVGGRLTLYVNDGSGSASPTLIDAVQASIHGDGTKEDPGVRPAGIIITYRPAIKVDLAISATIQVKAGTDFDTVKSNIIEAITNYVNSLPIGEDVIIKQIEKSIGSIFGVVDYTLITPSSNIEILKSDGEIAKISTITLDIKTYIEEN